MDQLHVKWGDFEEHTAKAFQTSRNSGDFSDVTLVCEDGHLLDTHKLVLSASSQFFRDLFKMNNHSHPLIFLRGVKAHDLVALVDFLYNGEAKMSHEHIESFLAIADDLKIKGLAGVSAEKIVAREKLTVRNSVKANQEENMGTELKTIQEANFDVEEEKATSVINKRRKFQVKPKSGKMQEVLFWLTLTWLLAIPQMLWTNLMQRSTPSCA